MRNEDLEEKYAKYIGNLKNAFSSLQILNFSGKVEEIVDLAKRYFKDAEYFKEKKEVVTALISLAYSEGLLDALKILNYINFSWRLNNE